jgi:anti-sigma regulatory factor (Ser/Thr protein kinase)
LARQALARNALSGLDNETRDDALLLTSELVTNAVRHAGCEWGEQIEVVARRDRSSLRITVSDPGRSRTQPVVRERADAGGLGLRLVQALARRWAVEHNERTHVWAELAL